MLMIRPALIRYALATAAATALGSVVALTPAHASTYATVVVQTAPPPPHYEAVPAPRRGMVWVPGHWEWRHHRYEWVGGMWMKARPGYAYQPPTWVEREGRWHYDRGRWDRDRDGIPNRHDRDRDGDGVPNRHDRRPDNPHRY